VTRLRIRWWDSTDDGTIVPWVYPALVLAPLFLNPAFWYGEGPEFPFHGPALQYFIAVFGEAALLAALFYLGPALAAQSSKRSVFGLAETSLGSIGALGLRVGSAIFLVLWLGEQINVMARWLVPLWTRPVASEAAEGVDAVILVLLVFWTGVQNLRIAARLAFFTNKLAIALLIAALIRVRAGWPAALHSFDQQTYLAQAPDLWAELAKLSFWAAPLLFLASNFGRGCQSRKQITLIGLFGIAGPVAVVLCVLGFTERAAHSAGVTTQGIANIGSALFGGNSMRYFPEFTALLAIAMLGTARYGIGALVECLTVLRGHRFVYWSILGLAAFIITVLAATTFLDVSVAVNPLVKFLVAAAAVLSADFLTSRWRVPSSRKIDWVGATALLAGWGLPYSYVVRAFFPYKGSAWWDPWLLRTYTVSFLICLLCRVLPQGFRHAFRPAPTAPRPI
jgi:hypothetical protein